MPALVHPSRVVSVYPLTGPVEAGLVPALCPLQSPQTMSAAVAMHSTCHTVSIPNVDRTLKFQRKCTKISDIMTLYR